MKHTPDQDLLLLAHNSLGMFRAISTKLHLRQCATCRGRYAELTTLSFAVASAFRTGLPTWKPLGLALRMKVLIGILVIGVGAWGVEQVVLPKDPPPIVIAPAMSTPSTTGDTCEVPAPAPVGKDGKKKHPRPPRPPGRTPLSVKQ